ncbi:unnamed protein product [Blumeria hordei]|uniref:Protein SQS1 n=1 Tax=Blumeria hordei TaxID=2867405 RepID=A0A383UPH6_BLUHO|nr:unnamed protein product [Blumeria hordei]
MPSSKKKGWKRNAVSNRRKGLQNTHSDLTRNGLLSESTESNMLPCAADNRTAKGGGLKSGRKLRYTKVRFVAKERALSLELENDENANSTIDSNINYKQKTVEIINKIHEPTGQTNSHVSKKNDGFVIDLEGGPQPYTGLPPPRLNTSSPTPSDSSEEIILYKGRSHTKNLTSNMRISSVDKTIVNDQNSCQVIDDDIKKITPSIYESTRAEIFSKSDAKVSELSLDFKSSQGKPSNIHENEKENDKESRDNALMEDYIANINLEGTQPFASFASRELGAGFYDDNIFLSNNISNENSDVSEEETESDFLGESDSDETEDLETFHEEIQEILAQRERNSGIQYLVSFQNHPRSDASWVPATSLTSTNAKEILRDFEEQMGMAMSLLDNSVNDTLNCYTAVSDTKNENINKKGSIPLKGVTISDSKRSACTYSQKLKQNKVQNTTKRHVRDPIRHTEGVIASPIKGIPPKAPHKRNDQMKDSCGKFNPKNPKKARGKKKQPKFINCDSEVEEYLESLWQNDRRRKAEKKSEREKLRAQGLIGCKNEKPDLRQKYKGGLNLSSLKEELKPFLASNSEFLALPYMGKTGRKIVHDIASTFNLKSRSMGSGKKRFPVIYRTTRTLAFSEKAFSVFESRSTNQSFHPTDTGRKLNTQKNTKSFKKDGGYRDGDVVGGSAPEIPPENKGRAMLEKMGWSLGTALGALDNKGILQPVSHVVKTTKAGLG